MRATLIILHALAVLTATASARTWYIVPDGSGDAPTIQAGLDSAVSGDTVMAGPGTYTGSGNRAIRFNGKSVVLKSSHGWLSTIVNCQHVTGTPGFHFQGGEDTTSVLDGFTIMNGDNWQGGGMYCMSSSPKVVNSRFYNNTAVYSGGAVYLSQSSPVFVEVRCELNDAGSDGGAVYCERSSAEFRDGLFYQNSAEFHGGAVFCVLGEGLTFTGSSFEDNSAGSGGGLYVASTTAVLENVNFVGNQANSAGGGMYSGESACSLFSVSFVSNTSGASGGGLYANDSAPENLCFLDSVTLRGNAAVEEGGGLYLYQRTEARNLQVLENGAEQGGGVYAWWQDVDLGNVLISGNTGVEGAGLYVDHTAVVVDSGVFTENLATSKGGAAYFYYNGPDGGRSDIRRSDILGNSAVYGGGFYTDGSDPALRSLLFEANVADSEGGGLFCAYSEPTIDSVTFADNKTDSTGAGGGLLCLGSAPTISSSFFRGNFAGSGGGARFRSSSPVISWTTIRSNSALYGGGVSCYQSSPSFENVTFCFNRAGTGGAVYCAMYSEPWFANTILAYSSLGGAIGCASSSDPIIEFCCVYGNAGGDQLCGTASDNIFLDPLFCDTTGNDLYVSDCSPCVGGGILGATIGAWPVGCSGVGVPVPRPRRATTALFGNFPNPFNPSTAIRYELGEPTPVSLRVYDVGGRLVRVLLQGRAREVGETEVLWDGRDDGGEDVAPGVYFVRLQAGEYVAAGKMVLVR